MSVLQVGHAQPSAPPGLRRRALDSTASVPGSPPAPSTCCCPREQTLPLPPTCPHLGRASPRRPTAPQTSLRTPLVRRNHVLNPDNKYAPRSQLFTSKKQ